MQVLTEQMETYIANSSWIRRMFEAGMELKREYGADNVFDFSLGNPDLPPPPAVGDALRDLADRAGRPLVFGYVPNAGLPATRRALAEALAAEQEVALTADHVVVTCGAAGGLNVVLRSILDRDDEVICSAPYFVEYGFYAANHGGRMVAVQSEPMRFGLDLSAVEQALSAKTRAVIINSPNNPSGQIYAQEELAALAELLKRHSEKHGRPVFLVSDEPYRFLTYDNATVPPVLPLYAYSVVVGSFSKSLSLAGERVGYIAANPRMPGIATLMNGLVLANRILGFVNAPVIAQHLVTRCLDAGVDVSIYDRRRGAMARVLDGAGIEYVMPRGAFYFFPRVPQGGDDKAFCATLQEQKILAVPGTGFGCPGFFRLTFCVGEKVIEGSAPGFKRAVAKADGGKG